MRPISVGLGLFLFALAAGRPAFAAPQFPASPAPAGGSPSTIDLATALRLAGASNIDVQIAQQRLEAARAASTNAVAQFLPWLSAGASYRRHGGLIQDVVGSIVVADKHSYTLGGTGNLQVDVGDALFRTLAARQTVRAADYDVRGQQQEAVYRAANAYFDLLEAQATVAATTEALEISRAYEAQLHRAVEVGIAFKGDELRVKVQSQRDELARQQALEQQRILAARLAETLRLDPAVELVGQTAELAPLPTVIPSAPAQELIRQALAARPELSAAQASVGAAEATVKAVRYGPLIPSLAGQMFLGGLGGGRNEAPSIFGGSRDYFAAFAWRIGPGGLGDFGRVRAARARLSEAQWIVEKAKDSIGRQVVEALARVQSEEQQVRTAKEALDAADQALTLTEGRRQFEVGIVLENILAQQDQARARQDYARTLGEFNKAQYGLSRALGLLQTTTQNPTAPPVEP
jgi:outer membrane protein TolC